MTVRERFHAICAFERPDRQMRWEIGPWGTTVERWRQEGAPEDPMSLFPLDSRGFGQDQSGVHTGFTNTAYAPAFEHQVLGEDESTVTYRDGGTGITMRQLKVRADTSMPQFLEFPVKCRADYEALRWRLVADTPERWPAGWEERARSLAAGDGLFSQFICGAFGNPRNLMGDDRLLVTYYDDPELIHLIQRDWLALYTGIFERLCAVAAPDYVLIWEDMCYKGGPLIGPGTFREFQFPYYRELIGRLKELGVRVVAVDTDGNAWRLLPLFVEAGVDMMIPFEVQAGMDVREVRAAFPRLVIVGGLDKRTLATSRQAIDDELVAKLPAMYRAGGYIATLDHSVPPDVPWQHFCHYMARVREYEGVGAA